jgi:DNA-binding MarR family transcriptional regulator
MNSTNAEISEIFLDLVSEFYEADSKARTFGTGTELYHSEILMLQCIDNNPCMHISGMARMLGITRGAASQTIKRLEQKKMIVKKSADGDSRKIVVHLTPVGKTAAENHRKAHEKYHTLIAALLADADVEHLQFLTLFLQQFRQTLRKT